MGWLGRVVEPPPDPGLDPFRDGVASLTLSGEVAGYLFTRVTPFWGLGRPFGLQNRMWLYFHYLDDLEADPDDEQQWEEDYPPWALRAELERGWFHDPDRDTTYKITWLTGDERAAALKTIGMGDDGRRA